MASELIKVESLRTIDRARLQLSLPEGEVARLRGEIIAILEGFHLVPVQSDVIDRASQPFPTTLRSLDAIHLASALLARDSFEGLGLATHDHQFALGAQAVGFTVHG